MVVAIAIIFSQVYISGMLLNFLIYTPYIKANYSHYIKHLIKGEVSNSQNALFRALLSGKIQCHEFTKALYNSICGVFYLGLVVLISYFMSTHSAEINTIMWQLEEKECTQCGA